jgi:hypothetical protein
MRLHRDTRFSPDKTPYHTHLSGLFWEGSQKKTERPAFGFRIEATGMGLMTGMFRFPPTLLAVYREAVLDDHLGAALEDALETVRRTGQYAIAGEGYKRVPAGHDPHHQRAALLPPENYCHKGVTSPWYGDHVKNVTHFERSYQSMIVTPALSSHLLSQSRSLKLPGPQTSFLEAVQRFVLEWAERGNA